MDNYRFRESGQHGASARRSPVRSRVLPAPPAVAEQAGKAGGEHVRIMVRVCGFDHGVGHVGGLRRRSESLAVLCKRLQNGVGIVYENLVKDMGILRQSCKERKKNWEMFSRHAEWPKVADAVIEAEFAL